MRPKTLLTINLKLSGSILLLPLSWTIYLHLHQLLFQVEGCGLLHHKSLNISATYSPPPRDIICNLLSRLSEIESSVNALSQTVDLELLCLDVPPFLNSSSFPLHHLFLECHHLDADLETVKSKVCISRHHEDIYQRSIGYDQ